MDCPEGLEDHQDRQDRQGHQVRQGHLDNLEGNHRSLYTKAFVVRNCLEIVQHQRRNHQVGHRRDRRRRPHEAVLELVSP